MDETRIQHKFELLKIAREMLNEEYLNKRAEDHNRWIAANDLAKLQNRLRVPYPPFVPFPTEADILYKARALYAFVYDETEEETVESIPTTDVVVEEYAEKIIAKPHGVLPGWIRRSRNEQ
jgi:hypothetical protein